MGTSDGAGTEMSRRNPETPLTHDAISYLRAFGFVAWRQNSGVAKYKGKSGNVRLVKFGFKGLSDVGAVHVGTGRYIACETKLPGEEATVDQQEFIDEVNAAGGAGFVAHSLDELHDELVRFGLLEVSK